MFITSQFPAKANFSGNGDGSRRTNGAWFVTENEIYTVQEVKRITRYMEKRRELGAEHGRRIPVNEWMIVNLALRTGLRVSEIAALDCGDISPTSSFPVLFVRNGKGGKTRIVEIDGEVASDIRWFLEWKKGIGEETTENSPLFVSGRSRQRRYTTRGLEKLFKRVVSAAGIKKRNNIHMARHTYASHLVSRTGQDWNFVKNQLGHSSIEVTQVYVHVIRSRARKALSRLYS